MIKQSTRKLRGLLNLAKSNSALKLQVPRLKPHLSQGRADQGDEIPLPELAGREIHGHTQARQPQCLPVLGLGAGRAQQGLDPGY